MPNRYVSREEILQRVAAVRNLKSSSRLPVDAVGPQYQREIFDMTGEGVIEDRTMPVPIRAVDGFHLSTIKAGPDKGTGLLIELTKP